MSKMSDQNAPLINDCNCSEDTDVRGRCATDNMECKAREDTILFQIKNDYDLMHSSQIAQLTWLLDRKVSHGNIVKFFEETS